MVNSKNSLISEFPMKSGLPRSLSDEHVGLKNLCKFLRMTRRDRKEFLDGSYARAKTSEIRQEMKRKNFTQSQRDFVQLLVLYGDPKLRFSMWEEAYLIFEQNDSESPNIPFHSLEYFSLIDRLSDFHADESDSSIIQDAFGEWPGLADRISDNVPWAQFAAKTWMELNDRVEHWDELTEEVRENTGIQIFCLATIIDDSRLISTVTEKVEWFHEEYGTLTDSEISKTADMDHENSSDSEKDRLKKQWKHICHSIASAANLACDPEPDFDVIEELEELVAELDSIHKPLRAAMEIPQLSDLIAYFNNVFDNVSKESCFSWLTEDTQNIIFQVWKKEWESICREEVDELFVNLKDEIRISFKRVRNDSKKLQEAETELESLGKEPPSDFMERHKWHERKENLHRRVRKLSRRKRKSELDAYKALNPFVRSESEEEPKSTSNISSGDDEKGIDEISQPESVSPKSDQHDNPVDCPGEQPISENQDVEEDAPEQEEDKTTDSNSQKEDCSDVGQVSEGGKRRPEEGVVTGLNPGQITPRQNQIMSRITEALNQDIPHISYSVQLARLARQTGELPTDFPFAPLEASLYSNYLRFPDGEIASRLRGVFEGFTSLSEVDDDRDTYALMTLAATLRPSLLAPHSGALGFLSGLQTSNFDAVYQFSKVIAEKAQLLQGIPIDPSVLRGARSEASWEHEYEKLRSHAKEWHQQAIHKTMLYRPATNVWQYWLKPNQILDRLINAVTTPGKSGNGELESVMNQILDKKTFDDLVRKTDRTTLKRSHAKHDIQWRAIDQLHNHALQVVKIYKKKKLLDDSRHSDSDSDFLTHTLNSLRVATEGNALSALSELEAVSTGEQSLLSGAAGLAAFAIKRFLILFDPDHIGIDSESTSSQILSSGLFRYSELSISKDGEPLHQTISPLEILLNEGSPDTYEESFSKRLENGDMETAGFMLDWIESEERVNVDVMRDQLEQSLKEKRKILRNAINRMREKVESALALGYLSDSDRSSHDAKLADLDRRCSDNRILRFDQAHRTLSDIEKKLKGSLDYQKNKVLTDLKELNLDQNDSNRIEVQKIIDQNDIVTANELIDRIRSGEQVISDDSQPRFDFTEFFPKKLKEIDKAFEKQRNVDVVGIIKHGAKFANLNFGRVAGARRDSAARMLNAWYTLKKAGISISDISAILRELFSELGFRVLEVKPARQDKSYCEVELQTEPVEDRELCPIPAYGSKAAGVYRIVVLWGRPTVEDILQFADDISHRKATMVLFMGRLREESRRAIAQLTRSRTRNLIVIDENLIVFLCSETGSRIPTLFACTLPFTYVQPFVTTAGPPPPEMFYGREREMRDIADPAGPCFIYGGRQLGKTALLRAVERKVHMPSEGHYAFWMDLKGEGIGYDRGPGDIWPALWRSLVGIGAVSKDLPEPNPNIRGRVEGFIDHLRSSFSKRSHRTLLLLLDEADRFLEVDSREEDSTGGAIGYRESTRLKSLMDNTERSVKVVFAGLHNVLRTVEYSNHPLGHFGEPIQIGPLLSDGAWKSATALLRDPMLAAGYDFQPPTLITRVLAQTNYYPSLIQLYGSALIKAMVPQRICEDPLYSISEDVLDETYQSGNLRDMIRTRFHLTLQLDPRYEVITYAIAYQCQNQESVIMDGLDQKQIDDAAREWWPEGFREIETGTDRFRSLLDEMVGLGVLRSVGHKQYTLRNPNLLILMGNEDEIADNLLKTRELPQEFEPELFRARNPGSSDDHVRSPLTLQQERSLLLEQNGVTVLCGFTASGLNDVLPYLRARGSRDQVVELKNLNGSRDFEEKLKRLQSDRKEGTTIYVVSHDVPWSEIWVEAAINRILKLKAKGRYAHVLFLSDAGHLWQLQSELEELNRLGLKWLSLRPWKEEFLRQWMEDVGFGDNPDTRLAISEATGLWPGLILQLYEQVQEHGEIGVAIEKLQETMSRSRRGVIQKEFGLDDPDSRRCLNPLAIFSEANFQDLLDEVSDEGIGADALRLRLNWAERLHLIRSHGKDKWEFDSIAAKLIA